MKKTLIAALLVSAGVASQGWAQPVTWPDVVHITTQPNINGSVGGIPTPVSTTKLGLLNINLVNTFQAYSKAGHWGIEVLPHDPRVLQGTVAWDNISYTYADAVDCLGTITYRSNTRQINNAIIIGAINKALSWPVGKNTALRSDPTVLGGPLVAVQSPYIGQFSTTTAKIVVVNYDNGRFFLPPYPPTQDYVGTEGTGPGTFDTAVWNAPYNLNTLPVNGASDGDIIPLNWPNQNYISWGKIWNDIESESTIWAGARVFIIDPANVNVNLRCFDVTPFFALEESYCYYCWDTMDRVTDGTITFGTSQSTPPCASGTFSCGLKGSGTTKIYWTVKFNNVMGGWGDDANAPNYLLSRGAGFQGGSTYYNDICGFPNTWGDTFGWKLDDSDEPGSVFALDFAVNGIATYPWRFKVLSDGATWPMGTYSMSSSGHGFSPMCGLYSGPVTMTEYDRANSLFHGVWCLVP